MHANQIAPVDAALWLAVGGIACLAAVECARRAADWLREHRERAFRRNTKRLRKVAMLRARLNEADEMGRYLNTVLDSIAMSIPAPLKDQHQQEIKSHYSYSQALGIAALTGKRLYYSGGGWVVR